MRAIRKTGSSEASKKSFFSNDVACLKIQKTIFVIDEILNRQGRRWFNTACLFLADRVRLQQGGEINKIVSADIRWVDTRENQNRRKVFSH